MAILQIQTVQSLDAPELVLYRTLKRVEEHERAGVLVAANIKVVRRLLSSRFTVVSALLTPAWLEKLELQLRARLEIELSIYVADQKILETITGYKLHQGALAVAKIPPLPDLGTLLKNSPRPLLLAAVEGIASAENLGAVVRSCAAFGAQVLIVGETCGSPFQRRAVAGSMGTIFEQPVVRAENLVETMKLLRSRGINCIAAHPSPGAKKLSVADLRGDCCLGVRRGRAWTVGIRAVGMRRCSRNPDAEPHEFAERCGRCRSFFIRSNPATFAENFLIEDEENDAPHPL